MKKEIIKPFDLEKAKAGAKLRTREGYPVEIFKWDARGKYPIVGIIKKEEADVTTYWYCRGSYYGTGIPHPYDLFIVEEVEVPKFKVKDWVIDKQGIVHQIVNVIMNVTNNTYGYNIVGGGYFNDNTEGVRLWTIDDAKAGDVLVCKGNIKYSNGIKYERICLFNNVDKAFFTLTKISNFVEGYGIDVNIDYPDNTVPATKEQKEILFMVMKEVGYEWNAEKLELKKIKPEFWSDDNNKRFNGFKIALGGVQKADDFYNLPNAYHIFATEKQAKSALAMARISQIMANDIENFGGVVTDEEWDNDEWKFVIYRCDNHIKTTSVVSAYHFFAFHTEKQRDLFLEKYPQLVRDYLMIDE